MELENRNLNLTREVQKEIKGLKAEVNKVKPWGLDELSARILAFRASNNALLIDEQKDQLKQLYLTLMSKKFEAIINYKWKK